MLQRKLSRKQKRSRNRDKARLKVARIHGKIYDTRKNFHYQTAHKICKNSGMIFVEDLNLVAMNRGMLRKHTLDAAAWCAFQLEFDSSWVASAFGAFLNILENVCFKRGVYFAKVDAKGTSQTCPVCGTHTGKKELRERIHRCENCGYETHRDYAAAEVIRQRGLEIILNKGESSIPTDNSCVTKDNFNKTPLYLKNSPNAALGLRDKENACDSATRRGLVAILV